MKYKKRNINRENKAKLIPLTRNHYAIVDSNDFLWLNQWNWHLHIYKNSYYAIRHIRRNGKITVIRMHEAILGKPPEGMEIDHCDCYGLNNMRSNIRFCTHSENLGNSNKHNNKKNFSSKYKGVYKGHYRAKRDEQTWSASIYCQKKSKHLGTFTSENEAAKAYDTKALERFGKYARLNFPQIAKEMI
jgi:hypothetical protein